MVDFTGVVHIVDADRVQNRAGFPIRAPVSGPHRGQLAVRGQHPHLRDQVAVRARQPVHQILERGLAHPFFPIPRGPESPCAVAEGVVHIHRLDRAAMHNQVPHGAPAARRQLVEIRAGDRRQIGHQRVLGLAVERLVELPDEVLKNGAIGAGFAEIGRGALRSCVVVGAGVGHQSTTTRSPGAARFCAIRSPSFSSQSSAWCSIPQTLHPSRQS